MPVSAKNMSSKRTSNYEYRPNYQTKQIDIEGDHGHDALIARIMMT
jgi:hypothetical protein